MIIVKITVMLILITAVYVYLWESYIGVNPSEQRKLLNKNADMPRGGYMVVMLTVVSVIGVFASAIYLLFIR